MILHTVYIRHFRSFNFDFIRQGLSGQTRYPWDGIEGGEAFEPELTDDSGASVPETGETRLAVTDATSSGDDETAGALVEADHDLRGTAQNDVGGAAEKLGEGYEEKSYYPFVSVPLDPNITTIVGANESGKSQLISAIECLLGSRPVRQRDFCRYSTFFGVRRRMRVPEFGGRFTGLSEHERTTVSELLGAKITGDFWFFRLQSGPILYYYPSGERKIQSLQISEENVKTLCLPNARRIDSKVVLPSSASLFDLAEAKIDPDPRSRNEWLQALKALKRAAHDSADPAASSLLPNVEPRQTAENIRARDALGLIRALLQTVADVDDQVYSELLAADGEDDGYSSALTTSITETLGASLNFQKWWSQDRQFSLQVHKEGFHLVFTLKDKTGQTYTFDERSGGMQYFLSYFIQRESYEPVIPGRSEILLMDEPDAYLSSLGQQDLLRVFSRYAFPDDGKPAAQVLYVTHSPFLIDKNYPQRIRVLQKGLGEEGTRVVRKASIEQYEPLRSAFSSFHADTAFIGTCNLLVEGPADLILFSGLSAAMKQFSKNLSTLDLNNLTMVPVHGAGNYRYMIHLTRGKDVDRPAVIVLLDSDDAGGRSSKDLAKLENGFGDKPVLDPKLILRIEDLDMSDMSIEVDKIQEPEDLVPAATARRALEHFIEQYRDGDAREVLLNALPASIEVDPSLPLFDQVRESFRAASDAVGDDLGIGKIEFAYAVSAVAEKFSSEEDVSRLYENFGNLFSEINRLQHEALRQHASEKITEVGKRLVSRFKRDHKVRSSKQTVTRLLDEVESHLEGIAGPAEEAVRRASREIRATYLLSDSPLSDVEDFRTLRQDLDRLVLTPQHAAP